MMSRDDMWPEQPAPVTSDPSREDLTDKQKLETLIQKAIDGGYSGKLPIVSDSPSHEWHPYGLIFNHDFAKALWGDGYGKYIVRVIKPNGTQLFGEELPLWKVYLQQMVIAEDPIDYAFKAVFREV